jgi:PAS domain S-box-containing protein
MDPSPVSVRPPGGPFRRDDGEVDRRLIRGILDGEGEPTVLVALNGGLVGWNVAFEELNGAGRLGMATSIFDLLPSTVHATWHGWLLRLVKGETISPTRTVVWNPAREEIPAEVLILPTSLGEDRILARIRIRDRSRETQVEQARRASDERFRMLCALAPVGVFQTDGDGRLTFTNDRWRRLAGLHHVTDPKGVWWQAVHPEDRTRVLEQWQSSLRHGHEFVAEFRFMVSRGQFRWGRTRIAQQCGSNGRIESCIGTSEDITDLKRIEVELAGARDAAMESARIKTEFLSNISHEILTPMNGVIGMLELLTGTELNSQQRGFAGIARESAEQLMQVMGDLLDFSRLEAGRLKLMPVPFEPVEIMEAVRRQFGSRAEKQGLELECRLDPHLPSRLTGDPARLHQVVSKLVDNALKFTREGSLRLGCDLLSADERRCVVRFEVTDTGPGIGPEVLQRIFQPFVQADGGATRRHGGAGLGLALARQLVELMGGEVRVESTPGQGTSVWFQVGLNLCVDR